MQGGLKNRSLVAAIRVEFEQERVQPEQGGHHQHPAIAVLNFRRVHQGVEQQALGID